MRQLLVIPCLLGLACVPASIDGESESIESEDDSGTTTDTGDPFDGRCDPAAVDPCAGANTPQLCCSDDPTAIDLEDLAADVVPAYQGRGGEGTPIFSGANNLLSRSGACVAEGSVAPAIALVDSNAVGCPVPCNPLWSASQIVEICGSGALCCQAQALEPEDCVLDPTLGDAGCWRPVTGADITGLGGADASDWSLDDHATHQDPGGTSCELFVASVPQDVFDTNGITTTDLLVACFVRLSVADQRGHCQAFDGSNPCPVFADPCAPINVDELRTGCE
jgi:hypothetical protein